MNSYNDIPYEVDFLPVGEGERSGDAIAVRWQEGDSYKVLVYDGGTKVSGQAVVDHIRLHYNTNKVDYVVNSHPDSDHASGLSVVLEKMEVGELWMHCPWIYSEDIRDYFHDGRMTDESLANRLKDKMAAAHALFELANEKQIPIYEPFQGQLIGRFRVLSPEKIWYVHDLIQAFNKSPEQKNVISEAFRLIKKAISWVAEHWDSESLRDDVTTSAENESSAILLGEFGNKRNAFLTGDAGVDALSRAVDYAESIGIHLPSSLRFVQVPHHGSRNNVSTAILDRILGERQQDANSINYSKSACVSAGKTSVTHPRQVVVNAFVKRGAEVNATKGNTIRYNYGMPSREGWVSATPLSYSESVEAWD